MEQLPELREWNIYRSAYGQTMHAFGTIFNDPKCRFVDGIDIRTSAIKRIDVDKMLIHTLNTTYKLV